MCKISYQSADKCATHKHLGVHTPINATFSKTKIGIKSEKKTQKTYCGMKKLPPNQTSMQTKIEKPITA